MAHWGAAGAEIRPGLLRETTIIETRPALAAPGEGEDIVADYRSLGLTLGRHPLALLRDDLAAAHVVTSADLRDLPHGRVVRVAGIVTARQRPQSAGGVMFITLEDETGYVNLIVWERVWSRARRIASGSRLLEVAGMLQKEQLVTHVVAQRLVDRTAMLGSIVTQSRDFR